MKKLFVMLLLVAIALGCLTGCGSSSTTQSSDSASQTAAAAPDTLNLAVTTGDGSTTDDRIPTPWMNRIMATNLMFRALFLANSDLTDPQPDLAESVEISDDGLTYTIKMKDDLKWSDGEELTADDVIFSIETAQKTATINSIYTSAFSKIASMEVSDNTVTLELSSPYASMLDVLAQFAILPQHCLKDADPLTLDSNEFWTDPVCSGMYTLDELNVGNYFTLKQNEYYEGTAPKIENITCYFVSDFVTAAQSGYADYLFGNDASLVETLEGLDNYTEYAVNVLFYKYFIFNMKGTDGTENEAMEDPAVRKALIEAIDRATLATLYPTATVLNSGVPNDNEAYNGYEYTFDAEQAKADLQASGYDMSRTLRICYYNNDQTSIDLISAVVYYLEQTGITVEATLSNDGTTDLFTTRDYDIGFKGKSAFSIDEWYTEYMSSDALFSNIFGGSTEFDSLLDDLLAAHTAEDRNAALTELQAKEQECMYKVPLFTVGTFVYTSDRVKLPEGVTFCNPLYMCDLDFENWEIVE